MTSVNIKEEIYFVFFEKANANAKLVPEMINEQLRKDIEEKRL